eukprot:2014078-Prymnesium_polylepis.2
MMNFQRMRKRWDKAGGRQALPDQGEEFGPKGFEGFAVGEVGNGFDLAAAAAAARGATVGAPVAGVKCAVEYVFEVSFEVANAKEGFGIHVAYFVPRDVA